MRKFHFNTNESYLHLHAKRVLAMWIAEDYERIVEEEPFFMAGRLWFTPDLTCYTNEGIKDLYEVVNSNDVDVWKQWRMHLYFSLHNWNVNVFTLDARWIMRQVEKPKTINLTKIL